MNHREQLLDMIGRVLSSEWTVEEFGKRYSEALLDEVLPDGLTSSEESFFGDVLEKLDYTASRPADADRQHGWIDETEFATWLRTELALFERMGAEYVDEHCRRTKGIP